MFKKLVVVLLVVTATSLLIYQKSEAPSPAEKRQAVPTTGSRQTFDKAQFSLTDPNSQWIVVNKKLPLTPLNYAPADLVVPGVVSRTTDAQVRQMVALPLQELFTAAKANGTPLRLSSAYRSYSYQVGLYNGYVAKEGQAAADAQSARPGFSEHQTGLAVDVGPEAGNCEVEVCFKDTPAGQWVASNAYRYGFIIRYGEGLTGTTGYSYEPWHLRYIGRELAAELQQKNIATLEEFFGLPAAPNY